MTCLYGVHIVGRVQLVFGIFSVISSVGMGPIVRKFGKMPILIIAAVTNIGVVILLMLWNHYQMNNIIGDFFHVQHSHFRLSVVYIIASLWGVTDAVWQTQVNALYGVLFYEEKEAAFSCYTLLKSIGFLAAYATTSCGLCIFEKMIFVIIAIVVGMIGYITYEIWQGRK